MRSMTEVRSVALWLAVLHLVLTPMFFAYSIAEQSIAWGVVAGMHLVIGALWLLARSLATTCIAWRENNARLREALLDPPPAAYFAAARLRARAEAAAELRRERELHRRNRGDDQ